MRLGLKRGELSNYARERVGAAIKDKSLHIARPGGTAHGPAKATPSLIKGLRAGAG